MDKEIRNYKDYSVLQANNIILAEVDDSNESHNWVGSDECIDKYNELKEILRTVGIIPLDDLFGSWGLLDPKPILHPYRLSIDYTTDAVDHMDAIQQWELLGNHGEYTITNIVCMDDNKAKKPSIHIVYWDHEGAFRYRMSNGSTGSTPSKDITKQMFEAYWVSMLVDREVTFEDIT